MFENFVKKWGPKKLTLSISDLICSLIAVIVSLTITANKEVEYDLFNTFFYEKLLIFLAGAFLVVPIFRYYQLYKHKYFLKTGEQTLLILKGLLIDSIVIILLIFIIKTRETLHDSRTQVIIYFTLAFTLLLITRILIFRKTFSGQYLAGNINKLLMRRAAAIGAGRLGRYFAETIANKQHYHIELVGYIDDDEQKQGLFINGINVLGNTNDLNKIVDKYELDELYITIQNIENINLLKLIEKCKLTNCTVNMVSNHFDIINRKWDETEYHDLKIISISSKVSPLYSEKLKRIFDILMSSVITLFLSPFILLITIAIKLTSRGPVLYTSTVIGKNGKEFKWYKFRTMYTNNDPTHHREHLKNIISRNIGYQKLSNDPRVTLTGRILRKFSIDELPQLINVFKGNMSLVGPRPCLPYEYEEFKDWHKLRYKVIPGMTGLAQIIARNRKDVSFNDSIILDLYYADNQSLWLDIRILFKTVPIMVFGKGGV
jgi:undecaprenyl-phosphate galactose phosphotransferase